MRDESVIGQILTCPKCGSMVLVEPPSPEPTETEPAAPVTEQAPSAVEPASDFADTASLFDQPTPTHEPPAQDPSEFADTVEDISVQGAEPSEPPPRAFSPDEDDSDRIEDESPADYEADSLPERPLLPNADWTSPTAAAWKNRALTGIVVIVGIALALTTFFLFNGRGDSDPPVQPPSPVIAQVGPELVEPTGADRTSDQPNEVTSEPASTVESAATPDEPTSNGSPLESRVGSEPAPAGPDLPDEPTENDTEQTGNTVEEVGTPEPTPTEEPIETPPGLTPIPDDATNSASGATGLVADTLRDFGALLDPLAAASSEMEAAELDPEVTPDGDASDEAEALSRPGARVVDVDARLRDPILAIEFKEIPLTKCLRFISDYSTIPVTLDPESLIWSKLTPVTRITVEASNLTVAEVLTEALTPLGLYYRIESAQLFVTRRPKNETGLRTVTFKVHDLVGDDTQELQRLGEMIMDLVEPDSWTRRGGNGSLSYEGATLVMEQEEPVLFEVLAFCQKMRVASGLPIGGQYAPSTFRLDTRTARAKSKLAQPISLTYIRPASFQRIVDRISEAARLHILIDWRTLAEADWNPDAEVAFATAGEPLGDALAKLLKPMDLTYRVVSESVLQITTQEAFDARLEVEFYRIGTLLDKNSGEDVIDAIHKAIGNGDFRDFGGDNLLTVDPNTKCLLASMSQSQHVRLEKWLAEQEAAGAALGTTIPTAAGGFRIAPVSDPGSND
ncbi:MAG: hypothetical protein CMJ64_11190 [Planctomycetaceae bacterium]|nr:hypothetical protein [Planctomycetaceae bacterium]